MGLEKRCANLIPFGLFERLTYFVDHVRPKTSPRGRLVSQENWSRTSTSQQMQRRWLVMTHQSVGECFIIEVNISIILKTQ